MNCKAKGSRNERRIIRLLEATGYCCTKSGGSLGTFDIIAIGPTDIVLVQCKSNSWPSGAEMESIRDFVCPPGTRKLVYRWRDRARLPDVRTV